MTSNDEWLNATALAIIPDSIDCAAGYRRDIRAALREAIERTRAEERAHGLQALRLAHEMQDKAVAEAEKRGFKRGHEVGFTKGRAPSGVMDW